MTTGVTSTVANSWLNVLRGTTYTGVTAVFVKLHIGDPGAAGTSNASALTTRNTLTWAVASGGSMALSTLSAYTMSATETVSHISVWDASSAGNFLCSGALTTPRAVNSGDTLTFNTLTASITPIAA